MGGLCEGGNEPPGSLKAKQENRKSFSEGTSLHHKVEVSRIYQQEFETSTYIVPLWREKTHFSTFNRFGLLCCKRSYFYENSNQHSFHNASSRNDVLDHTVTTRDVPYNGQADMHFMYELAECEAEGDDCVHEISLIVVLNSKVFRGDREAEYRKTENQMDGYIRTESGEAADEARKKQINMEKTVEGNINRWKVKCVLKCQQQRE
ncbi:hypothetical protein ANN_13360 [Periplaneta americana]|uniref:Uncharacterized protein n=1 Tax=Periplaneta americana TaxID=6978 RepID=A0ABQ8TK73_PERAM|nr:hypothetical protein ANN_13360 [Periplaneta americana]